MAFARMIDSLAATGRAAVLAAVVMAGTLPTALAQTQPVLSPAERENHAIVRNAFDKWAAGTNVFASLLAPDVEWTIYGSGPIAGTYRGRDNFVERASMPLVSRLATPLVPRVHHIWAAGDRVIVRFEAAATTTGGHPYSNQYVWIFRMRDGSVAQAEAFLDLVAYQEVVDNNEPKPR